MLPRTLEPEEMDTPEDVASYDAMDHSAVNAQFVADFLEVHGPMRGGQALDVGTGTARIPIELCRADSGARVLAIDLADHMIQRARANVEDAGYSDRIRCELADAKALADADRSFEAVISNSIIHHIPEPSGVLAAAASAVAPGGSLFIRDLARPATIEELNRLVATYAANDAPHARALFEASLHAALTVDEIRRMLSERGLPEGRLEMTSDRHWTWSWRRPESSV